MPNTSHPKPARARNRPVIDAALAARLTESVSDLAEDLVLAAESLMSHACRADATIAERLEDAVAIARLAEQTISALVALQRSQGGPLGELEPVVGVTRDRLRKKYRPQDVLEDLASRIRPSMPPLSSSLAGEDPDVATISALRQPRQRLACALTRMWRESKLSQRKLAQLINIDRSHVSRMLAGHRPVTLAYVEQIAEHCGGDIELVMPLWEATADPQDRRTLDPVIALRLYLRALRYAMGNPSDERIVASSGRTISAAVLQQALYGPATPSWTVVRELATALHSMPDVVRPLWRSAQTPTASSIPAHAFG
ncbi:MULTISPECIES: helix-turn-helix domain-containing protein [unclassified Streptomyces]|uniref:helix-turn-helix domain-containing protein n=1 Tax=unclassified Streptomyces TaxID=2593676 RepID=UPI0035E316CC